MTGWIGIALGDFTGIGPEVALKALAEERESEGWRYLLLGDVARTERLNEQLGLGLPLQLLHEPRRRRGNETHSFGPKSQSLLTSSPTEETRFVAGALFNSEQAAFHEVQLESGMYVHDPCAEPLAADLAPGSPAAAHAALAYLTEGAQRCLRHELDALVTAPVNKEAILRAGHAFVGQTELLSQLSGTPRTAMMLLGEDDRGRCLRVALATTHVPLKLVADQLETSKIERAIELAAQACRDLGLSRARVGVCGLNPHAGEGGELGTEEITVIAPAVKAAQERQFDVAGPLAADSLFYRAYRGEFDAVVAMYHDQGLAPLKMIGFERGVNWTLGLPFIRTSPDHGTAYDIAGRGVALPSSMRAALSLAKQLVRRQNQK